MSEGKTKLKVALLMNKTMYEKTLHPESVEFLKTFAEVVNEGPYPDKISEDYMKEALAGAEACITCWGTPMITGQILDNAPELKLIAHSAGTPKAVITEEVWNRKIRVFTAAPIIAIDVAETALGVMISALKCIPKYDRMMRAGIWADNGEEVTRQKAFMKRLNYRLTVGIVSASHVGNNLIRMLQPFAVNILLYDPYVTEFKAREMGVKKVTLEELMSASDVVSIHAPNIPQTYHMISRDMLALMKDGALFINTSRGPVVDEDALIVELKKGRIHAYLDVYNKEPLPKDSPLYGLDNVILTPHISGGHTVNGGYERGDYVVHQLHSYHTRGILRDETVKDMMGIMA